MKYIIRLYRFVYKIFNALLMQLKYSTIRTVMISTIIFIVISIISSTMIYENTVLIKREKKVKEEITELNNEIKIANAEYMHLISPNNLKELNDNYTPNYKAISEEQKLYLKDM